VEPNNTIIQNYLQKLQDAPQCTLPSTLAVELQINPFLRTHEAEVQKFALQNGATSNDSLDVFKVLRQEKNVFK
jgi:hydroxyacylglutathione hydrolase